MTRYRARRLSRAESDRLLDVGTGADPLSALLAAATASQLDQPLPGEDEALAHFRAARTARARKAAIAGRTIRGAYAPRPKAAPQPRRQGLKVAAAAIALTLTSGVAVAATGSLPASLQRVAHKAFGAPGVKNHGHGAASTGATGAANSRGSGQASDHPTPNASPSPSLAGLCVSYRAGATSNPKVLDNPAFSALIAAAGGVERVAGFCDSLVPQKPNQTQSHPSSPSHPTHPPTKPKPKG